jgi:hypothetical protein
MSMVLWLLLTYVGMGLIYEDSYFWGLICCLVGLLMIVKSLSVDGEPNQDK